MNYTGIEIDCTEQEQKEIFIALLDQLGFEGFEETETKLKGFIPEKDFDVEKLKSAIPAIPFRVSSIEERNWNKEWESNFQPVVIDDFCGVRAEFHPALKNVQHEIVITPKMSFGTGHHATTEMMIRTMQEIDFSDKSVFDFGTGTGILAILAEKLGAKEIIAIDNDDWSIENAVENIQRNECSKVNIQKASGVPQRAFEIILANITKSVIVNNFLAVSKQLRTAGVLVISGLLVSDEPEVIALATKNNLQAFKKLRIFDWICLGFRKADISH